MFGLGLVGGLVSGAMSAFGASQQNKANAQQQQQAQGFNAEEADKARAFNAEQAQMGRDFSQDMFNQSSAFNASEAQKSREYQTSMSNTQYQRATQDAMSAGLNPMLAYTQGGAGTPSGATASASPASGPSASGPSASTSPVSMQNTLGGALPSAVAFMNASKDLENKDAQNDLIKAQTNAADAQAAHSRQSAGKTYVETELMADTFGNQVDRIVAEAKTAKEKAIAEEFENSMNPVKAALKSGEIGIQQATRRMYEASAGLSFVTAGNKALETPGLQNEASYQKSGMGGAMPYVRGVSDIIGAGVGSAFGLKRIGGMFK